MERWDDLSRYQWSSDDAANDALMAAIAAEGVIGVYIEAGSAAAAQWDAADRHGLRKRGYVYLNLPGGDYYTGLDAATQVANALATYGGRVIERLGLDCEDPKNNLSPADTYGFILAAIHACVGKVFSDIYTAPEWWRQYTGDTHMCADAGLELWLANPTNTPPASMTLPDPFGGWTQAYMVQYDWHGKPEAGGPEVDEDEGVEAAPPLPTPEQPTDPEVEADALRNMVEITGPDAIKAFDDAATATLGRLLGGDNGVHYYARKEQDGTVTFTVEGGSAEAFKDVPELA